MTDELLVVRSPDELGEQCRSCGGHGGEPCVLPATGGPVQRR